MSAVILGVGNFFPSFQHYATFSPWREAVLLPKGVFFFFFFLKNAKSTLHPPSDKSRRTLPLPPPFPPPRLLLIYPLPFSFGRCFFSPSAMECRWAFFLPPQKPMRLSILFSPSRAALFFFSSRMRPLFFFSPHVAPPPLLKALVRTFQRPLARGPLPPPLPFSQKVERARRAFLPFFSSFPKRKAKSSFLMTFFNEGSILLRAHDRHILCFLLFLFVNKR